MDLQTYILWENKGLGLFHKREAIEKYDTELIILTSQTSH